MKKRMKKTDKRQMLLIGAGSLAAVLVIVLILTLGNAFRQDGPNPTDSPPKNTAGQTEGSDGSKETSGNQSAGDENSKPADQGSGASGGNASGDDRTGSAADQSVEIVIPTYTEPDNEDGLIAGGRLTCDRYSIFSGKYVEDGKDEPVENVAAILVTNHSDQFLDYALLTYDIGGETAQFRVTGLPAGRSAWVMEINRLEIDASAVFLYVESEYSFRDGVISSSPGITITDGGNRLIATNNTNETLENFFVYYKTVYIDGNFFGGITYAVEFGTLKSGETATVPAGHYVRSGSEIVRIGWQDG